MTEPSTHPLESGGVPTREAGEGTDPETGIQIWQPALRACDCGRRATHTVYNERNTMSFVCDLHAQEIIDEADNDPDLWTEMLLVEGVEETADERRHRLTWQNLLPNGAMAR